MNSSNTSEHVAIESVRLFVRQLHSQINNLRINLYQSALVLRNSPLSDAVGVRCSMGEYILCSHDEQATGIQANLTHFQY